MQEYKCPACGGALEFDSKLQKVKCPYCDSEYTMEELKSIDAGLDKESASDDEQQTQVRNEWTENEESGLRSYVCQSNRRDSLPVLRQSCGYDGAVLRYA